MEQLHKLEHSRELFGYNTKDFKKYSKHTKNQIKYFNKTNNEDFTKILKCENFLSRCYLEKNKKLKRKLIEKIIKFAEKFENGLKFYYKGMAYFLSKNFKESKEELVKSRRFFEENPIFLQEIDYFLDLNGNKLNEPSLKPSKEKGMWNDIELQFNTLKEKEDYFSYKIKEVKGNDFDSLLKNFILKIHFRKENLIKLIKKSNTAKLKNIKEKSKQLFLILKEFLLFSQKNYISSEFIDLFYKDTQNLFYFFKNLEERNEGNFENEKEISEFKTPTNFEGISEFVEQSKKEIKLNVKKVKSKLMQQLEKNIQVEESKINLPFLPVFYDLAYEFIDYELEPSSKKGISGLLSKFSSSFSLKK